MFATCNETNARAKKSLNDKKFSFFYYYFLYHCENARERDSDAFERGHDQLKTDEGEMRGGGIDREAFFCENVSSIF